jgi:hypothetical protein
MLMLLKDNSTIYTGTPIRKFQKRHLDFALNRDAQCSDHEQVARKASTSRRLYDQNVLDGGCKFMQFTVRSKSRNLEAT